jgi:FkbM family methyltransferase
MEVENVIHALMPRLLKAYDPKKEGVTVDVGVGNFILYFKLFADLGYRTIAIEPLISPPVRKILGKVKVELFEGCLLDRNDIVEMYTGWFDNGDCYDVSSVNKDWWGVTGESKLVKVPSIDLQTLISRYGLKKISYFKIDTEGSEYQIIKQFKLIDHTLLPQVVEFEYGGGASKGEGAAGWNEKYFEGTLSSINELSDLGYNFLLLFDVENELIKQYIVSELTDMKSIFADNYVYGNILMFKEKKYELEGKKLSFTNDNQVKSLFGNI